MNLIDLENAPRAYLLKHEAELTQALRAGMSAKMIYRAFENSEDKPPMSYRQFCRFTKGMRTAATPVGSIAPDGAPDPGKPARSYTRGDGDKKNILIPTFKHHRRRK